MTHDDAFLQAIIERPGRRRAAAAVRRLAGGARRPARRVHPGAVCAGADGRVRSAAVGFDGAGEGVAGNAPAGMARPAEKGFRDFHIPPRLSRPNSAGCSIFSRPRTGIGPAGAAPDGSTARGRNHVSALLSCPFLSRLKRLDFNCGDGVDFDGETLRASDVELLASSTVLAHLTSLSLKNNRIGPESVRLLTASSWITGLRELNLCSCEIGAAGVEALAECAALSLLERLDLSRNRLTAASTQALTGRAFSQRTAETSPGS